MPHRIRPLLPDALLVTASAIVFAATGIAPAIAATHAAEPHIGAYLTLLAWFHVAVLALAIAGGMVRGLGSVAAIGALGAWLVNGFMGALDGAAAGSPFVGANPGWVAVVRTVAALVLSLATLIVLRADRSRSDP